jgi:hypothetical protein
MTAGPGQNRIIAAHYFYLLRGEDEELKRLWAGLAADAGIGSEPTFAGIFSSGEHVERCAVLHCAHGEAIDFCLAMLPNLSLVEVVQRSSERGDASAWSAFFDRVETYRSKARQDGIAFFGESTLLVTDEAEADSLEPEVTGLIETRLKAELPLELAGDEFSVPVAVSEGKQLVSDLDPAVAGGTRPQLVKFPGPDSAAVEYYVLAAQDPGETVANLFPDLDSLLKELNRSTSYFSQQKKIVVNERADVDSQIGKLLHKQTVATEARAPDTHDLETSIAGLSRMFGLLATDSLMIRQADKRLEGDLSLLARILLKMMNSETGTDAIGAFYTKAYTEELENVRNVSRDLDHSRQNAEAAISVVRTRIDLLRAEEEAAIRQQTQGLLKQSLMLQEEGLALQVSAGLIEFVLVFYYVLKSWEAILGLEAWEHIAPLLRMIPVFGIAAGAAAGTHFLARSIKNKTWKNPWLWVSAVVLVASLLLLVVLSVTIAS